MNDLDLRTALHRDADLVGDPSPDLLDQLARRRSEQRRQRTGVLVAALAVVAIGASIPVGQALLTRSDGAPADQTTVVPTTAVPSEDTPAVTPTPEPTPDPTPEVAPDPTPSGTPEPEAVVDPGCPDQATLLEVFGQPTDQQSRVVAGPTPTICSGGWALAVFGLFTPQPELGPGAESTVAYARLFRFVDGAWTPVDRFQHCDAGDIPDDIWELVCNAG